MFRTKQAAEQLFIAVKLKKTAEISRLIKFGVDVNSPIDKTGKTCLHYAVFKGEEITVKVLIESGADLNIKDENGHTPLHRAMVDGHAAVLKILVDAGCSLDTVDENGNTALHEAAWNGYSQCASVLLSANSNVNIHNKTGYSPLHLAAQNGHMTTVQVLLKSGSYSMSKNNYGDTPLHIAVRYGHEDMSQTLIAAGVNVSDQNNDGNTPLHVAAQLGHSRIVDLLLDGGSTIAVRNNVGDTARDIAMQNSFKDIVKTIPSVGPSKLAKQKSEKVIPRHLMTDTASTFTTTNTLLYVPRPVPGNPVPKKPWQRKEYLKFLSWRSKKEEESNVTRAKKELPPLKFEEMCSIEKEFSTRSINRRSQRHLKRSKEIQEKRKSSGFYSEPALELRGDSQQEQTSTTASKEQVSEDIRVSKSKHKNKGLFNLFRSASDPDLRTDTKKKGSFFSRKLWDRSSTSTKETGDQLGSSVDGIPEKNELEETRERRMREPEGRGRKHEREWVESGGKGSAEREERKRERKELKNKEHTFKSCRESDQFDAVMADSSPCHSPRTKHRSPHGEKKHRHRDENDSKHKNRDSDEEKHKQRHRRDGEAELRSKSRERKSKKYPDSVHAQFDRRESEPRSKSRERKSKKYPDSEHVHFDKRESESRSKSRERKSRKHSDSDHAQLNRRESESRSKSRERKSRKHSDSDHAQFDRRESESRSKSRERNSRKHPDTERVDFESKDHEKSTRYSKPQKDKEKKHHRHGIEDKQEKHSAHERKKMADSETQTGVDVDIPTATILQVGAVPCHVISARCETCSTSMRSFEARQEQCAVEIDSTRRTLEHRLKRLEQKFDKQFSSTDKLRREQESREKYEYERIVCRVTDECREVSKNMRLEADEIKTDVRTVISDGMENLEGKMERMATSANEQDKVSHAYMYMGCNTYPLRSRTAGSKLARSTPVIGTTTPHDESLTVNENQCVVSTSPSCVKDMRTNNNFSTVRVSQSQALDTLQDPTVREHSQVESLESTDSDPREGKYETHDVAKPNESPARRKERGGIYGRISALEAKIRTESDGGASYV